MVILVPLGLATLLPGPSLEGESPADSGSAGGHPVVVELFTSQGCSSCPPADRLLGELGPEAIPLSFHVDYWNYLGWRDPFSSERWSERQRDYARRLPAGRVYTPQLVVAGRSHLVGSNAAAVRRALLEAAAAQPAGSVELELTPTADAVEVRVAAEILAADGHRRDLWVALRQSGLVTPVASGENARRTLENDHVVRRFEKAFHLAGEKGAHAERRVRLALEADWPRDQLSVVAFLQREDWVIDGAAWAPVNP
jgi:hypothetical protein